MIHTHITHWRSHLHGEPWETVFTFLEREAATAPEDVRLVLNDSGLYALVMRYDTRGPEHGVLEAHNTHIDVQMSLVGNEWIDWYPRETLHIRVPYDAAKDVVLFERPGIAPATVDNLPGRVTILFPEDAHMAQQCGAAPAAPVKKVVVKVPIELIPHWGKHK